MKYVYQGKYIQVAEEKINDQVFEKAYFKNSIITFPINKNGEILLIKEKRVQEYPQIRIKPVTGFCEKNLSWQENTQKEMQEEIGLKAGELILFHHHKSTGGINTQRYFSIATQLQKSFLTNPDGDVIEEIIPFRLDDAIKKLLTGEIKISSDSIGLFLLYHNHELRKKYGY